jgi:GNAT superfamily N-acetyltransferase
MAKLNAKTLAEVGRLRIVAWEASGPRPRLAPNTGDTWTDSHDEHAHHWIIREQDEIVAAARMCIHTSFNDLPDHDELSAVRGHKLLWPVASMNRLVVHPDYRRKGLSRLFDLARIDFAESSGAKSVVVTSHPQSRIRGLLELGFDAVGEFSERVVPSAPTIIFVKILE